MQELSDLQKNSDLCKQHPLASVASITTLTDVDFAALAVAVQDIDVRNLKALIIGPHETPYEFGFFEVMHTGPWASHPEGPLTSHSKSFNSNSTKTIPASRRQLLQQPPMEGGVGSTPISTPMAKCACKFSYVYYHRLLGTNPGFSGRFSGNYDTAALERAKPIMTDSI